MFRFFVLAFAILALVGWAIQSNAAQTADVCPGFIAEAIETVGNNCGSLSRNNACYGYNHVTATFEQLPEPDYFTTPSDLADLFNLRTISTTPLRANLNEWGITLLSVQANLPDALPGQNVIFMLAGDVEMESAVDPEALADPNAEQTPMQAFYFRTGIAQTDCNEAPDTLIVQGPRGVQVDFTANGADIRIGSTVALRTLTVDPAYVAQLKQQYGFTENVVLMLELFVFDGEAILNPGTPNEVRVPQGYRALRCLNEPDNLGIDGEDNDYAVFGGCPWVDIRPVTPAEIQGFAGYEGTVLNYTIILPDGTIIPIDPTLVQTIPPAPTAVPTSSATDAPQPTATSTTPSNVPPELTLYEFETAVPRDEVILSGTYSDPDDDVLFMNINWGDGTDEDITLDGEDGGGGGGFARLVAGGFDIPHVYLTNGMFDIVVTLRDGAGNQVTETVTVHTEPIYPLSLSKVSGDGQTAYLLEPFADPLVALLKDANEGPVVGYWLDVYVDNATVDADCEIKGPCHIVTDADGLATVEVTAGNSINDALVYIVIPDITQVAFNLEVVAPSGNQPPTVDITTDQLEVTNGDTFTLDYGIDDPDGDLMNVEIYWGDSDTPEGYVELASGAYFADHEFMAVGTMTITVVVSDGELTDSDTWVIEVLPVYPLTVSHYPHGDWTGEVVGGNVYPGMLRIYVRDSLNDLLQGEPIYHFASAGMTPTTTLDTPGTGFADVTITSDCLARDTIYVGAADPTASYDEGFGGRYRVTSIAVNQIAPYTLYNYETGPQTTYVGTEFPYQLAAQLVDHNGEPVTDATIRFFLDTSQGSEFTTGGTEYTTTTDSGGYSYSPTIRAGDVESFYAYAEFNVEFGWGGCSYYVYFELHVENFPGPVGPFGIDGAEATEEVILPESTAEVTDEPVAPEVTDEAPPPESTQEVILPEETEEAVFPVLPTYTPTPTGTTISPTPTPTQPT